MIRTALLLLITIIIIPVTIVYYWQVPDTLQIGMLKSSAIIMIGISLICFLLSRLTSNCSQVDKVWSVMPMVYTWYFVIASNWDSRVLLMAILASIWGIRLTFNFARKGGYRLKFWEGEEDYRWEILRQRKEFKNPVVWFLFELVFISFYQNALVWLFTLPAVIAVSGKALNVWDVVVSLFFISWLIVETIADQQQWIFQTRKKKKRLSGEKLTPEEAQGFVSSGLWKYSRHPNYAAEQLIWITFYCFSIVVTSSIVNWSLAGAFLLVLLFYGSSNFSEDISSRKYPNYKEYQKKVSRYFPGL